MKRPQMIRFAAFVTVLAVLLGYVVYHRTEANTSVATSIATPNKNASQVTNLENYFVNYRMQRDRMMSQEISTLKSIVGNPGISQAAKDQATLTMVADTQQLKEETQIEGLLSARGFPLSAVTVTSNRVDVVVGADSLTTTQVARIADTATQVTGLSPQDVIILPKN